MFLFGCVTRQPCREMLFDKLKKCENNGFDAYGIAMAHENEIICAKGIKGADELEDILPVSDSNCGFIHARWATCGERTEENAHPFMASHVCVAANGTVENAAELRSRLSLMPYPDSDAAVLPHLIAAWAEKGLPKALLETSDQTTGDYSLAAIVKGKNEIYALQHGAPLYAAQSSSGTYISSSISAFPADTSKIFVVAPGEIVQLTAEKIHIFNRKLKKVKKQPCNFALRNRLPVPEEKITLYDEIQAVPFVLDNLLHLYTNGEKTNFPKLKVKLSSVNRIYFVGCGTSHHLAKAAACNFEAVCDIPSFAFSSAEYCASNAVCDKNTLFIALSASGETAETVAAVKSAEKFGAKIIAVTADMNSRLARLCKNILPVPCAEPGGLSPSEMFDCGYVLLCLLAVHFGLKEKTITPLFGRMAVKMAGTLPDKIRLILKSEKELKAMASLIESKPKIIVTGQNVDYATACECATYLRRTTGRLAVAVPAGEIRHTSLWAVDGDTAVFAFVSGKELAEKTCSALTQARIRGASTLVCTSENLVMQAAGQSHVFAFPDSLPLLAPVCHGVTMQLLSTEIEAARQQSEEKEIPEIPRFFAV